MTDRRASGATSRRNQRPALAAKVLLTGGATAATIALVTGFALNPVPEPAAPTEQRVIVEYRQPTATEAEPRVIQVPSPRAPAPPATAAAPRPRVNTRAS